MNLTLSFFHSFDYFCHLNYNILTWFFIFLLGLLLLIIWTRLSFKYFLTCLFYCSWCSILIVSGLLWPSRKGTFLPFCNSWIPGPGGGVWRSLLLPGGVYCWATWVELRAVDFGYALGWIIVNFLLFLSCRGGCAQLISVLLYSIFLSSHWTPLPIGLLIWLFGLLRIFWLSDRVLPVRVQLDFRFLGFPIWGCGLTWTYSQLNCFSVFRCGLELWRMVASLYRLGRFAFRPPRKTRFGSLYSQFLFARHLIEQCVHGIWVPLIQFHSIPQKDKLRL